LTAEPVSISEELVREGWRIMPDTFAQKVSNGAWVAGDHHRLVGYFLYLLGTRKIDRLGITLPVGHGKSYLSSWWFPCWDLHWWPSDRFILGSHSSDFSVKWGRLVRETLEEHEEDVGVHLKHDSQAMDDWETTVGGGMRSAGIGANVAGRRAEKFLIDDPHSSFKQAHSVTAQEEAFDWYRGVGIQRLMPRAPVGLISSRWCENDLMGRIKKSPTADRWVWVHLPAIAEEDETIATVIGKDRVERLEEAGIPVPTWFREEGQPLWPRRYDVEAGEWVPAFDEAELADRRIEGGEYNWAGQYQGRPVPLLGGMFKRSGWNRVDVAPAGLLLVRRWDLAATEGGGDWTAGVLMGMTSDGRVYILDVRRDQLGPGAVERFVYSTSVEDRDTYGPRVRIRIEQEGGSSGKKDALRWVTEVLAGYDVSAEGSTGDKGVRALGLAAQQGVGNVFLVRRRLPNGEYVEPEWWEEFIDEAAAFGVGGAHDDQIDAASLAYTDLLEMWRAKRKRRGAIRSVAGRSVVPEPVGRPRI
jgi:predicted phage terminase large subunit-like protein